MRSRSFLRCLAAWTFAAVLLTGCTAPPDPATKPQPAKGTKPPTVQPPKTPEPERLCLRTEIVYPST